MSRLMTMYLYSFSCLDLQPRGLIVCMGAGKSASLLSRSNQYILARSIMKDMETGDGMGDRNSTSLARRPVEYATRAARARLFLRLTGMTNKQAIAHLLLMGELQVAANTSGAPFDISFGGFGPAPEIAADKDSGRDCIKGLIAELRSL